MIRATAKSKVGTVAFLGLEPENMARLQAGQPIRVNLHDFAADGRRLDVTPIDQVVVFYAKTGTELRDLAAAQDGLEEQTT